MMANIHGTRWRGKIPIPEHAHPLVRQFIGIANKQMTTLTDIERRAGIRRNTMSDWRYRRNPTITNLDAALNAMGYCLAIRTKR